MVVWKAIYLQSCELLLKCKAGARLLSSVMELPLLPWGSTGSIPQSSQYLNCVYVCVCACVCVCVCVCV